MHTILVWVLACQAQVSLRGFFISDCDTCGRGLNTSAFVKDRYWGKVAEASEWGGEASALTTNGWRVKCGSGEGLGKDSC